MKFLSGIPPIVDGLWNWNSKDIRIMDIPFSKFRLGKIWKIWKDSLKSIDLYFRRRRSFNILWICNNNNRKYLFFLKSSKNYIENYNVFDYCIQQYKRRGIFLVWKRNCKTNCDFVFVFVLCFEMIVFGITMIVGKFLFLFYFEKLKNFYSF